MAELTVQNIKNSLEFINKIANEEQKNFKQLIVFITKFGKIFDEKEKEKPYHINLIHEFFKNKENALYEDAHSRIFNKIIQYKDKDNEKFPILQDFVNKCGFDIEIKNPIFSKQNTENLDNCFFEKGKYAVIIESKCTGKTGDQPNQIARYIDTVRKKGYNKEQIFVIYTPKNKRNPPNENSWELDEKKSLYKNETKSYKEEFENRFKILSYRNDIYYWLKE